MATAEELNEKKMRILAKWADWEANAKTRDERPNMSKFVAVSKGTNWETNLSSMHNWTRRTPKATGTPNARTTPAPIPTTLEGMRAEMARQQQALKKQKEDYINLLKSEVARLRVELAKAEQELEEFTAS